MVVLIEGAKFCCHSAGLQDNYIDFIWALWFCRYICQGQEGILSVSQSLDAPWSICSSNPAAFTQEGLVTQPMTESLGKRLLAVIPPAMGHLCRDIKWNFWFSPPLGQKRLLSIVLCWPGASNSSFQNNKWIPTDFHARSTWRNKSSQLATLPCLCLAYQFTS